jgi:hypothetical protein
MKTQFLTIREALLTAPESTSDAVDVSYFKKIRLSNGVYRTTTCRRLDDVNAAALPFISAHHSPRILDVAASSGVSSAEWSVALFEAGVDHELHVADLVMWALWARWMGMKFLYEPGSVPHLLQVDLAGIAFPNSSGSFWHTCVFRILNLIMPHRFLVRSSQQVMFVGPAIRRHAAGNKRISFHRFDIFETPLYLDGPQYQVIRAANILNKAYFSDDELLGGLRNLLSLLDEGGVLIMARTHDNGSNHASVYVRSQSGLKRAAVIGDGYEADELLCRISM